MKTLLSTTAFLKSAIAMTLCLFSCAQAAAESITGVLEQSGAYSALFSASPESGDLIGYPFKNNSQVGKAILANCLSGLVCKIGKATTRELQDPSVLKFKDQPMGWLEITRAADVYMVPGIASYEKSTKTRFGILSINEETRTLLFKGKPVLPTIEGNNSLSIVANYSLGKSDVVLLQNTGGTACPALFVFLTITATNVSATAEFGTCSDIIYLTSDMKNSVTLVITDFKGPFTTSEEKRKAGMTKIVFRYANALVTTTKNL